jgi:hypothetical protein
MDSIVLELQRDTLNKNITVSELLRKALVISKKLNLNEFKRWVENELNGYDKKDDVPDYREITGEVMGYNPYNGWMPLIFIDPEIGEIVSTRKTMQSIAQLEELAGSKDKNSQMHMPFPQNLQRKLSKGFGFETQVSLFADKSNLIKILDAVRNIILNWTLKLEEDGILGEGLTFNKQERESAETSPQNITYFFGPVKSSQIQQGTIKSNQNQINKSADIKEIELFIKMLREKLKEVNLESDIEKEVKAEIKTLESQTESPKPKKNILRESLSSLKNIFENASGGAAAQILIEIGKLLAS